MRFVAPVFRLTVADSHNDVCARHRVKAREAPAVCRHMGLRGESPVVTQYVLYIRRPVCCPSSSESTLVSPEHFFLFWKAQIARRVRTHTPGHPSRLHVRFDSHLELAVELEELYRDVSPLVQAGGSPNPLACGCPGTNSPPDHVPESLYRK